MGIDRKHGAAFGGAGQHLRRDRRARLRAVALVAAAALVVAACGDDDDTGAEGGTTTQGTTGTTAGVATATTAAAGDDEAACTEERKGGSLQVAEYQLLPGLDPAFSLGNGTQGGDQTAALYDTLMTYDPATGAFEPRVAEALEPNADFSVWTLELRPDVRFGNGDPLTAAAVKASVERHKDPAVQSRNASLVANIKQIDVVDDLTARFTLTQPWAGFPYVLAAGAGMITNPAVVAALGAGFAKDPKGAGVGPYELETFSPGEKIVLRAKDDYWDGPVCIDEITMVGIPLASTMYDTLTSGGADFAYFRDPKAADDARAEGLHVESNFEQALEVMMNVAREQSPTHDLRVRQAVAYAIDPDVVNERQYGSSGYPTTSLMFEGSKFKPDVQGVDADPDEAKALVAEAKADLGWDGTIHFLLSGAPTELALAIKAQLDAVGFNTVLDQSGTVGDYISKIVVNHDFELAIWGYNLWDAGPYSGLAEQLLSTSATNFRGYKEPEMDAALGRLRLAADDEEATEVIGEIQTIFNETTPGRVISATELGAVWDDEELAGFEFGQFGMAYFDEVHRLG